MKSMWFKIRKAHYTQEEWANKLKVARNTVISWEKGKRAIPIYAQIEYLKLRNSKEDKIIIEYLKSI